MNTLRAFFFGAAFALLSLLLPTAQAALDVMENGGAGDGLGDIWQMKHKIPAGAGNLDSDGDGATNANEAGAGTDPHTPSDMVKVTSMTLSGGNVVLTWPSVLGKRYRIQQTTTLTNASSWTAVTAYVNGTGADLTDTTPAVAGAFFRVAVYDMDTDGDGLTDWEERQLGLDPENPRSHGLNNPGDLAWVTSALQTTPAQQVVTIEASESSISENSSGTFFIIKRSAGLAELTVNFTVSGGATSGTDFTPLGTSVTIPFGATSVNLPLYPLADAAVEPPEAVVVTISPNAAYTVGQPGGAGIILEDQTSASGTGLTAQFWNEISSGGNAISDTNPAKFAGNPAVNPRVDAQINYPLWTGTVEGTGSPAAGVHVDYFSSRWTGEILPEFSQPYTIKFMVNRAGRVIVNGQTVINNWPPNTVASNTYTGVISLEGGKRYPIIVEQYETTADAYAVLSWSSANRPEEVIPANRLFPTAAPQILSPLEALTFVGGTPFSYQILASANPTSYSAQNLPPGLSVNTTTGLITGSPTQTGLWRVVLSAQNAVGKGSAIFEITVLQTSGGVVREEWAGVSGSTVASIPLGTTATSTSTLTSLQAPGNSGDNYGARIRGYITAPTTGTYQFWLAADEAAELYISDDEEPVNAWLRASLTAPSSAPPTWTSAATSPLLYLNAGSRYYFEVRHKEATGADFLAVGWSKPGEATTAPSEIVPGYLLTQYTPPGPVAGESTLFVTSMNAQNGAATNGFGSASLQLSADKTEAIVRFTYSNLTGTLAQKHVHSGADGGLIMFDMDATPANPDGSYTWKIVPVNGIADKDGDGDSDADDIVKLIQDGSAYLNLHTALFPAGEIKGFFRLASGSQTFVAPPSVPDWNTDPASVVSIEANAVRFLQQATFGGSAADITELQNLGYEGWIDAQFAKPITLHEPLVEASRNTTNPTNNTYTGDQIANAWWRQSIRAQDQLRQRVAFALSEILVVSEIGPLDENSPAVSDYYDMLLAGHLDRSVPSNQVNPVVTPVARTIAGVTGYDGGTTLKAGVFGNFRDILIATTLHPAMGRYLDMLRNDKPNLTTGTHPNENYAREILQLFSLGLNRLHPDGSLVLNSQGLPIDTYDQDAIIGFAHAFTGWDYNYTGAIKTSFSASSNWVDPLSAVPLRHFTGTKRVLNNVVLPGLPTVGGAPLDPYASHTAAQYGDPTYQALAGQEILSTHNQIFNHPNCGPFICKQLIQRLVTSTPSRGYVYRVVQKFNDNGSGVRGDMKAVIKAILLDYEARSATAAATQGYGKQREPLLRVTQMARLFPATSGFNGTWQQDGGAITMTSTGDNQIASGQTISLNFTDTAPNSTAPLATSGTYTQSSVGGLTSTSFSVRAKDCIRGTYAQSSNTVTITAGAAHGLSVGHRAYVRFRSPSVLASGLYEVKTVTSSTVFTIDLGTGTGTSTGGCDVAFLRGGYTIPTYLTASSGTTATCTVTTTTNHGLGNGANVWMTFTPDLVNSVNYAPADGLYAIAVTGLNTFTITITYPVGLPNNTTLANVFNGAAQVAVVDRGGTAANWVATSGFEDFTVGSTDTDLGQTPLDSPTVFNFFLPEYQYPGELAQAGLITPEFQLTSDTSVIRQANFLYNGLFNPAYTTGISSFKSGGADIGMDISAWMDIRPSTTTPWTDNNTASPSNDNLRNLIRKLGTLLMGRAPSTAMENEIYNYVSNNTTSGGNPNGNIAYTNGSTLPFATAGTTDRTFRRDRVRAVIHLIVTSPEYTIQK